MGILVRLPLELIIKILSTLDWRSILQCKQVCRLFADIIADSAEMQYKVELAVAGMEDGPPSALSSADRLKLLRTHQATWKDLNWTSEKVVPMLAGGVWELYGGVLAQAKTRDSLCLMQLASELRGIPEKEWELQLPMHIRDFGMEPALDLLVVIEELSEQGIYRIHLLKLSTGERHPCAPNPAILTHPIKSRGMSFAIQISNLHVAVVFISAELDSESELVIWNWRTGSLEMDVFGRQVGSFSFLTETQILLATVTVVEHGVRTGEPSLSIIDFLDAPKEPIYVLDLLVRCRFLWPTLSPRAHAPLVSVRSDPSPSWTPDPDLKVPFHTARQDRLFVVTIWVGEQFAMNKLLLFIPSSTILSKLDSMHPDETGREFAWEEWGPVGTHMRFAPREHTAIWVCYVFGMSYVVPYRPGNQGNAASPGDMIQMFDFNQLALKRQFAEDVEEDEDSVTHIIAEPTMLRVPKVFAAGYIRTALPYRWRVKRVPQHEDTAFRSVMLSEDAIVTVASDVREYRVLSF